VRVKLVRNPVVQYLVVAVALFVILSLATSVLSARVAAREATADARGVTRVLARSVAQPAIPRGLVDGDAGAIDKLDREVLDRLLVGDVRRVKIWRSDGTILYSDETRLIQDQFPLDEEEKNVLANGGTIAEVSDLSKPENRFESSKEGLVEVYTRIHSPEGEPMLFEVYYSANDLAQRRRELFSPFQRITVGGLLAMLVVATPIIWVLTRRLTRNARERERLLRASMSASEAERRRIARDLHDGVVQDLAGTAFSLTAVGRDQRMPEDLRSEVDGAGRSLRTSLKSLRSLLVSIHPPGLHADGLAAALTDLTAPAADAHIESSVKVGDIGEVPDETVALVWRVAQEAVRNAIRHADASVLEVEVERRNGLLLLEVTDDGLGFDPDTDPGPDSFGLRGLSSLVQDAGGRLDVRSTPGEGTRVRMEVGTA
jgi:two-component system, NarL family, sensor kinase